MNCKEIQSMLAPFMAGELSGDQARSVRQHLACCLPCRSGLKAADLIEVLPALDDSIEPSVDFAARFEARLRQLRQAAADKREQGWLQKIAAWGRPRQLAAAGALALLIAIGVYSRRPAAVDLELFAPENDLRIAEKLPLLEDMAVINHLDLLEDFETIENLPDQ